MSPGPDSNARAPAAGLCLAALVLAPETAAREPQQAVEVEAAYVGEVWHNARGGIETGSAYLDHVQVSALLDAEALWGWEGTSFLLHGLYNNGNSLSGRLTGDLQTVSNIESGPNDFRIYEALMQTSLGDGGSMRLGLYDLNSEFDVLASSLLFVHSAHGIGTDIGQTGRNGPSIFPMTSLGVRVAWEWGDDWTVRAAAMDAVPGDPDQPDEVDVHLSTDEGALLISELERSTPGSTLLLGAWGYTGKFESWPESGQARATRSKGNNGAYVRGEWRPADDISLFARLGGASGEFNTFETFLGAGVHWQGPLPARPEDELGFAVAWAEASSDYVDARRLDGADADAREIALELTYRLPLGERVVLQPDLQYIINPGLDPALEDAFAVGLRMELVLF